LQDDVNDQRRDQHNRDLCAGPHPERTAVTILAIAVVTTLAIFSVSSIHVTSVQNKVIYLTT